MTKKEFLKFYKNHKSKDLSVFDFYEDEMGGYDEFICVCGKTPKTFIDAYYFKDKCKLYNFHIVLKESYICYHCAYLINVLDGKSKCKDCGKKDTLYLCDISETGWFCKACIKSRNDYFNELCNKECFPSND